MTAIAAPAGEAVPPAEEELCNRYRAGAREAGPASEPEDVPQEAALAELDASESDLEEIAEPEPYPEPIHLPRPGAGNVAAAAGCAVLALIGAA